MIDENGPQMDIALGARVIREPVGFENGDWVGAPGVYYEPEEKAFYLTYRIRRPHEVALDPDGEARIARSVDLLKFEDLWSVTKDQFNTASIERGAIRKGADGEWRYFIGMVDPADDRWCIDMLKAPGIQTFDPAKAQRLFSAEPLGLEGIKDPWIIELGGRFHMLMSVALPASKTRAEPSGIQDRFSPGECVSATGLAVSRDLDHWEWRGVVFRPEPSGWDADCRRITSVVPYLDKYFAFYDGGAGQAQNHEEKTGLAISYDFLHWESLTPEAPLWTSPHGSGSLRFLDAVVVDRRPHLFYECSRADGAHELRVTPVADVAMLPF